MDAKQSMGAVKRDEIANRIFCVNGFASSGKPGDGSAFHSLGAVARSEDGRKLFVR
jgi:hypothetical protein